MTNRRLDLPSSTLADFCGKGPIIKVRKVTVFYSRRPEGGLGGLPAVEPVYVERVRGDSYLVMSSVGGTKRMVLHERTRAVPTNLVRWGSEPGR